MKKIRLSAESKSVLSEVRALRESGGLFTKSGSLRRSPRVRKMMRAVALAVGNDMQKHLGVERVGGIRCQPTDSTVLVTMKYVRHSITASGPFWDMCAIGVYDEDTGMCYYLGISRCDDYSDAEWV